MRTNCVHRTAIVLLHMSPVHDSNWNNGYRYDWTQEPGSVYRHSMAVVDVRSGRQPALQGAQIRRIQ